MTISAHRYTFTSRRGDWLSRLERTVHIREVTGSNPVSPTIPAAPSYQLPGVAPPGYRMPWPMPSAALSAVDRFRPQVVHAQSPFVSGQLARRAARCARAPLVFTHHTRFADYRHYLGPLARPGSAITNAYLRRFWAACAAVIAPSAELAAEIEARRVVVIPTGVDIGAIGAMAPIDPRPAHGWP